MDALGGRPRLLGHVELLLKGPDDIGAIGDEVDALEVVNLVAALDGFGMERLRLMP